MQIDLSDEVRAAAERLRRIRQGEPYESVYGPTKGADLSAEKADVSLVYGIAIAALEQEEEEERKIAEAAARLANQARSTGKSQDTSLTLRDGRELYLLASFAVLTA